MTEREKVWMKCQSELVATGENLCEFRFPKSTECPLAGTSRHMITGCEDPMKSSIVRGWLSGLRHVA